MGSEITQMPVIKLKRFAPQLSNKFPRLLQRICKKLLKLFTHPFGGTVDLVNTLNSNLSRLSLGLR